MTTNDESSAGPSQTSRHPVTTKDVDELSTPSRQRDAIFTWDPRRAPAGPQQTLEKAKGAQWDGETDLRGEPSGTRRRGNARATRTPIRVLAARRPASRSTTGAQGVEP